MWRGSLKNLFAGSPALRNRLTRLLDLFSQKEIVVKSQILAGGRGLGAFRSGFEGGEHIVKTEEVAAAKADLSYIGLDGEIGCMVNGGFAMTMMDRNARLYIFHILTSNDKVKAILETGMTLTWMMQQRKLPCFRKKVQSSEDEHFEIK
ncbi:hypothetical protein OPV22_001746 [Ensete ventricosum]|uniref:ATP-grasp fold succinyl-CoA synthetase-type domain-containing protein n=1 Tax=Ensete ventricosum TaxID=4639 RepID=A0AAV8RWH8_ENSVE|nr:hypothetical protein OPV22_001746 [Ensete ventricosum]